MAATAVSEVRTSIASPSVSEAISGFLNAGATKTTFYYWKERRLHFSSCFIYLYYNRKAIWG